jgi:hypothetical protein
VDRQVRKGGQLVDDGRETALGLWTTADASPAGPATPAVENRSAHVDDRAGDYLRKSGTARAESPRAALVPHINREMLHHGAEIALLRDLYLWHDGSAEASDPSGA